jgi:hypothetical protein
MMPRKHYLAAECALLFFIAPAALYFFRFELAFKIVPLVWVVALLCGIYLVKYRGYGPKELWIPAGLGSWLTGIVARFLPLAGILSLLAWCFIPERFFGFPRHNPRVWAAVMLLYPLLAAYPQEVFYRTFFFERYRSLFSGPRQLVLINGLSFGIGHAIYGNWLAPVLSTFGGILFAHRYQRSESTLVVGIEHALWGDFIFTSGYGWYFYSGAIQ